jgi:tryptophan synthase beta chain
MFDAIAVDESVALEAGLLFAETENILPAPESAHAIAGAIELARRQPSNATPTVILINISGHGLLDIDAYSKHRANELCHFQLDDNILEDSLQEVEKFNELIKASRFEIGATER